MISKLCPPLPSLSGSAVKCEQKSPERLGCPQILTPTSWERADPTGLINKFWMTKPTATPSYAICDTCNAKNQTHNTDKSLRGVEEEERQKPSQLFHTENPIFFIWFIMFPCITCLLKPKGYTEEYCFFLSLMVISLMAQSDRRTLPFFV